ncbi:MAG: GntR family transcriptional regulator, partial [Deltaproteobacteria bacterium]|nr:GntR family transcriptional regulator [Deltaproteobacteria bacterium]
MAGRPVRGGMNTILTEPRRKGNKVRLMKNNFFRKSLLDEICDFLRDLIVSLRIKPGEQLNEKEFIEKLGVSRSPLREAFRLLEGEGLVVRHSRKGAFVREINITDISELFPIRGALERLAAELAAPKVTKQDLKKLMRITEKMEEVINRGDRKAYPRLNFDF